MTQHLCRVCPVYKQQPAAYRVPHVCDPCEARMARQLVQISDQWLLLDATPGGSRSERVTGTKEAPLGVRADVLDQLLPVGSHSGEAIHDPYRDQTGETPAGVVLDLIASEWLEARRRDGHRENRPVPTVPNLTAWLRDRLGWACSHLPDAIDAHADEVRQLCGRLHGLNGETRNRAEPLAGVPCPNCDHIALIRWTGEDYIQCTECGHHGTREDYERWTGLLAAHFKDQKQAA